MRLVKSVWLMILVAGGCSSAERFAGPARIDGEWAEGFSIAGSSLVIDLTSSGSTVSGTGHSCGEAGPCGTIVVTGTVEGVLVHLDLAYTQTVPQPNPTVTHQFFDGRFSSADELKGSVTFDNAQNQPAGHTSFGRVL